jgi:hypothetical protein
MAVPGGPRPGVETEASIFGPADIAVAGAAREDCAMATSPVRRFALVPDPPQPRDGLPKPVRRFHLARIAVSPRSALGADRHERMEDVARRDEEQREAP